MDASSLPHLTSLITVDGSDDANTIALRLTRAGFEKEFLPLALSLLAPKNFSTSCYLLTFANLL